MSLAPFRALRSGLRPHTRFVGFAADSIGRYAWTHTALARPPAPADARSVSGNGRSCRCPRRGRIRLLFCLELQQQGWRPAAARLQPTTAHTDADRPHPRAGRRQSKDELFHEALQRCLRLYIRINRPSGSRVKQERIESPRVKFRSISPSSPTQPADRPRRPARRRRYRPGTVTGRVRAPTRPDLLSSNSCCQRARGKNLSTSFAVGPRGSVSSLDREAGIDQGGEGGGHGLKPRGQEEG